MWSSPFASLLFVLKWQQTRKPPKLELVMHGFSRPEFGLLCYLLFGVIPIVTEGAE